MGISMNPTYWRLNCMNRSFNKFVTPLPHLFTSRPSLGPAKPTLVSYTRAHVAYCAVPYRLAPASWRFACTRVRKPCFCFPSSYPRTLISPISPYLPRPNGLLASQTTVPFLPLPALSPTFLLFCFKQVWRS